jgi:exodeoxyribonuclease VII small subunit
MKSFESQMEDLEKLLKLLEQGDIKLGDVSKYAKQAKKLYDSCKAQLDAAKMEIEDVLKEQEKQD